MVLGAGFAYSQSDSVSVAPVQQEDTSFVMSKSPWGAVLRSAVLPGWGQLYNRSYWKAPIVWGVTAWFVYNWNYNNNKYVSYKNAYANDKLNLSSQLSAVNKTNRDFYRDQRDLFAIYMGLAYVLTLVDAYVDAHMFDFTVQEDIVTKVPQLNLNYRLNF